MFVSFVLEFVFHFICIRTSTSLWTRVLGYLVGHQVFLLIKKVSWKAVRLSLKLWLETGNKMPVILSTLGNLRLVRWLVPYTLSNPS